MRYLLTKLTDGRYARMTDCLLPNGNMILITETGNEICSAQEYDDYRRTATTEIRHDGPPAGSIAEIHRKTSRRYAFDGRGKVTKTLNERIGQSFEIVRSQLENVQKGLGEMKSLAQDVGGLKKSIE